MIGKKRLRSGMQVSEDPGSYQIRAKQDQRCQRGALIDCNGSRPVLADMLVG